MNSKVHVNHYVYLLQSRVSDKCYIGVRSCKGLIGEDTYMGSSSVMTDEDKSNCNKIILKRCTTREEAVAYEIELHSTLNVVESTLFWNQAKQTSTGFDTAGRQMSKEEKRRRGEIQRVRFKTQPHPCRGIKLSEEHKQKIGLSGLGKSHTGTTKSLMSVKASGISNPAFVPWWYELHGVRTEVYDSTPAEVAHRLGVPTGCIKDRFRKCYAGKPKQTEPLQSLLVGRIKND